MSAKPIRAADIEAALKRNDNPEALRAFQEKTRAGEPETVKPARAAIHVQISKKDAEGNGFMISAELDSSAALFDFTREYRGYMPRRKIFGVI